MNNNKKDARKGRKIIVERIGIFMESNIIVFA